jgi:hypothetical protein
MLAAAFVFRQRLITQTEAADRKINLAEVQTQSIIIMALLEGAGLMGIVVYFLHGHQQVLYAVLAYIAVSAVLFFPRREWFKASPPM